MTSSGVEYRVRIGVLGTGSIAGEMVDAVGESESCVVQAIASRDGARAAEFGRQHRVERAYGSYDELLGDPNVDLVYVATPHSEHASWSLEALDAGKAVLCEKPLTIAAREAERVIERAQQHDAFLLEAFAYRFHPQTERLLELVRNGAIGAIRALSASFSFDLPPEIKGRAIRRELGGGAILDVGCYCTSVCNQIVAAATGSPTEPVEVVGFGRLHPSERTDSYAMGVMRFADDVIAQVSCGFARVQDDHVHVYGTDGEIRIAQPCWLGGRRTASSLIELIPREGAARAIEIPAGRHIFALEADAVARLLREGAQSCKAYWDDSLANMRTLDRWRSAVGVRYDGEAV